MLRTPFYHWLIVLVRSVERYAGTYAFLRIRIEFFPARAVLCYSGTALARVLIDNGGLTVASWAPLAILTGIFCTVSCAFLPLLLPTFTASPTPVRALWSAGRTYALVLLWFFHIALSTYAFFRSIIEPFPVLAMLFGRTYALARVFIEMGGLAAAVIFYARFCTDIEPFPFRTVVFSADAALSCVGVELAFIGSVTVLLFARTAHQFVRRLYFGGRAVAAGLVARIPRLRGGAVIDRKISASTALEFLIDGSAFVIGGHHTRLRKRVQKRQIRVLRAVVHGALAARLVFGLPDFRGTVAGLARAARAPLFHKHWRIPDTVGRRARTA